MPLLPGKKNIGHNIEAEMAHGKPLRVARAIALRKAYGKKKQRGHGSEAHKGRALSKKSSRMGGY